MATEAANASYASGLALWFFPSLAPALVISMGFIDLGKWVVAVEGGAQFGFDLVLLMLLFNCSAIFCQYLATSIGVVTRKNLAQICCEEYYRPACLLLGLQAELSIIFSDVTTVLGIAHAFNVLFGLDLFKCTVLAALVAAALPFVVMLVGKKNSEVVYASLSAFVLAFYVLGVLAAQPEIPVVVNGVFPRLTGENSYLIMALLGSNIIVHNFYSHSSMTQHQRRSLSGPVDPLLLDHFFAILFIFSGIFLANCVLMNSATSLFDNAGLTQVTFQDVFLLMDQMLSVRIAPVAFFLVLLFSSLVTAVTWIVGGQVVVHTFFGINISVWVHIACLKALAIVPAIYCALSAGAEGLYQLLIVCQVLLAMLLPSSVIPLFRVASSRSIMGTFTMSWHLEMLALFTFIWMLATKLTFVAEILLGSSAWAVSLRSSMTLSFVFLLIACISLGLMLYLMVTPLKSASVESTWELPGDQRLLSPKENDLATTDYLEVQESAVEPTTLGLGNMDQYQDIPELNADSDRDHQPSSLSFEKASASDIKESNSVIDVHPVEHADKPFDSAVLDSVISGRIESNEPAGGKILSEAPIVCRGAEAVAWKPDDFSSEALPSVAAEGSELSKSFRSKGGSDAGSGNGSISRLSGLGRAARRQFSAILDEFWGHLFDFHGQLTQEASTNKADMLLGLDLKVIGSIKTDTSGNEAFRKHLPETDRGSDFTTNSRVYGFTSQTRIPNKVSPCGLQTGSPSWFPNAQSLNIYGQSSGSDIPEHGERCYSSFHLPQYSDNRDYQPATIHGYQMSSYLRGIGAGRVDSSCYPLNQSPKSLEPFLPNYKDPLGYNMDPDGFGSQEISGFENQIFSRTSRNFDSSFSGIYEKIARPEKKYHSLPDISGRNSSFDNKNGQQAGRFGYRPSVGRMTPDQSQYSNPSYRAEGLSLTFDELSPSNYKDIFSLQSTTNAYTKSLWSRQPYEQLFGMTGNSQTQGATADDTLCSTPETFSYAELETKLLKSLKACILKLLKLDGSDWLFKQNSGADEDLIDQLVLKEKKLCETKGGSPMHFCEYQSISSDQEHNSSQRADLELSDASTVAKCGESCVWRAGLIVSFGVWCIHRILELSLVESRPELWGKYTYVLNRLQGIVEPAFSKPRSPILYCYCLEIPAAYMEDSSQQRQNDRLPRGNKKSGMQCTDSAMVLELIKDVEVAISGRKGRMGTAAGDVAFPKGKENLASVLKRYKRRLSNKSSVNLHSGSSSRKAPLPTGSVS